MRAKDTEFLKTDYLKAAYKCFYENCEIDPKEGISTLSEFGRLWQEFDNWFLADPYMLGYDLIDQPVNVYDSDNMEFEAEQL